jgi:hypothetical protein
VIDTAICDEEYLIVMGKKKTVEVAVSVPVKAEKKKSGDGPCEGCLCKEWKR